MVTKAVPASIFRPTPVLKASPRKCDYGPCAWLGLAEPRLWLPAIAPNGSGADRVIPAAADGASARLRSKALQPHMFFGRLRACPQRCPRSGETKRMRPPVNTETHRVMTGTVGRVSVSRDEATGKVTIVAPALSLDDPRNATSHPKPVLIGGIWAHFDRARWRSSKV